MSTFFEKLTGNQKSDDNNDESGTDPIQAPMRPQKKYTPAQTATEHTRHMKVTANENGIPPPEEPAGDDEEGELTVDIYDKGDAIIIQSTVAGVRPEDMDIAVTNDTVTLRGKREQMDRIAEKDYYYKELFWGSFARSIILPEEVDEELAEAAIKHGLLTIKLPKRRRGVVQKVKVKTV